jgi:hypothetical protein
MKRIVLGAWLCSFVPAVRSQEITLAITNCNVISMTSNKVLYHQTILIADAKIVDVVPAKQWSKKQGIQMIDGSGKYVLPALTDMHIHINQYMGWIFRPLLHYGVTTVRVMAGNEAVLKWKDSVKRNLKLAPDLHVASQVIDGNPPFWGNLHDGPVVEQPDSVEQIINDQISQGYEFIKIYNRLSPSVVKRFRDVCFQRNIKLTGHTSVNIQKNDILTDQTGEIEHMSGYARFASTTDTMSKQAIVQNSDLAYDLESAGRTSTARIRLAARETKRYQIWNCPTLVAGIIRSDSNFCKQLSNSKAGQMLGPVLNWWNSQGYNFTPEEKRLSDFKKAMLKELYLNKTNLLAGTDSPAPWVVPGLSLHQELQYMVEAGLSNYDALKTATVNPSLWFGKGYNKGTIEPGKAADLLILSDNPLQDIRNTQKIVAVIFKGRVLEE